MRSARACWVAGMLLVAIHCATAPELVPTPERPTIGCIADSPFIGRQKTSHEGNRLLPEIVRLIGMTSPEDGERWKVLRQGEQNPDNWQPWPKEKIQTGRACGPEADAFREIAARKVPTILPIESAQQ
jgi:hypothetical protein